MSDKPIHILYVEDSEFDRALVLHSLTKESSGIKVSLASNVDEFRERVNDTTLDLVLTDFDILGLTGIEVLEIVRATRPDLPTIIVSGTGSEESAIEAIRKGADDYVVKTAQHIERLQETIQAVLDRRKAIREAEETISNRDREYSLLRTLADTVPEQIFAKDRDNRYVFANSSRVTLLGATTMQDVIGKTDYDFYAEPIAAKYLRDERRVIEHGETLRNVEEAVVRNDGEQRVYLTTKAPIRNKQGEVEGIVIVSRDVTELQHREERLRRLVTAIEQVGESVVITDLEGRIEYVNPAFERVSGYRQEEVIGQPTSVLKSGMHDAEFYRDLWSTIARGEDWHGRIINKRKDGTLYHEDTTISPVRGDGGEILNYVAVKYDVTNQVMLERQLRQAQKLEAIGTLAGGIAHDFNNILASIMGHAEIVLTGCDPGSQMAEDTQTILYAADRARDLIGQILTFSRQREERKAPLRVDSAVKEVAKLMQATLPSSVSVQYDFAQDLPLVLADVTQIHQVVINLMTNAYQAMPNGKGEIVVSLRSSDLEPGNGVVAVDLAPGRYLSMSVSDTGTGMDSQIMDRIFDPFFTTKGVGVGSGLGLSTVHGIVTSYGGAVRVESELGKGSTFTVYLPVTAEEVGASSVQTPVPHATGRILIVDDEPSLAALMERTLSRLGYTVKATTSSREALSILQADPHAWDLLVTDLTMPHITGRDLAESVASLRKDLPVIITTGFANSLAPFEAEALGVIEVVQKPANSNSLGGAVARALLAKGRTKPPQE
jgi:PAS domain S-box-containing protein